MRVFLDKKNVENFVHFEEERFANLETINFSWIVPAFIHMLLLVGCYVTGKMLQGILILLPYYASYIVFCVAVHCKHVKKTFQLRFLVSGIFAIFFSVLFLQFILWLLWITDILTPLFLLYFTLIFVLANFCTFLLLVHLIRKDRFSHEPNEALMRINSIAGVFFPALGSSGFGFVFILHKVFKLSLPVVLLIFLVLTYIVAFFLSSAAVMHLLRYYFCHKFAIYCDVKGRSTTPRLDPAFWEEIKEPERKKKRKEKELRKKKKGWRILYRLWNVFLVLVCIVAALVLFAPLLEIWMKAKGIF